MRLSKQTGRLKEAIARAGAEDRALSYLAKFPPKVALRVALNVEQSLAIKWEEEQNDMIRRDDPREVFRILPDHMRELHSALDIISGDVQPDSHD
jgi:hypothetical protein